MKLFIVYFKFKSPGDKKHGPVRPHRIYANDHDEAKRLAEEQARYPNIEVLSVKSV